MLSAFGRTHEFDKLYLDRFGMSFNEHSKTMSDKEVDMKNLVLNDNYFSGLMKTLLANKISTSIIHESLKENRFFLRWHH